jgi:pimeloyl-ACP methyl ester carboxylesterase
VDLAYDRTGAGEPLVLLHGLGHRRQAFDAVVPLLAADRDVITVDLPAMGESPPPAVGDYRVMADMIEKLFSDLGLERPHVAGNSLGGLLSLELAARGSVRSATALSPAGFWNTPEKYWCVALFRTAGFLGDKLPDRVADLMIANRFARVSLFGPFFGRPSRHAVAELKRDLRGLGREHRPAVDAVLAVFHQPFAPPPPAPDVPTTIAWGRRDLLLFPHQARRAKRAFPAARFVDMPGVGHLPMGDDPEQVAAVLLEGSQGVAG